MNTLCCQGLNISKPALHSSVGLMWMWSPQCIKSQWLCTFRSEMTVMKRPFTCEHYLCLLSMRFWVPESEHTYLLSNARAWAGWRRMLRRQSQKWSLVLGLLWRPGCFLWSTWEPEFDPGGHSCPWLPGLLCLEILDWWERTGEEKKTYLSVFVSAFWFTIHRNYLFLMPVQCSPFLCCLNITSFLSRLNQLKSGHLNSSGWSSVFY